MKFIYPALFKPAGDGAYLATFPDLTGCEARGYNLDDTIENANEAAYDWIYLELSEGGTLPPITDIHDIPVEKGDLVRNICVNVRMTDGYDE